jgi:hypothetical protein
MADDSVLDRSQCQQLRSSLLALHRSLLDLERRDYEKAHGRQSHGDFLQVVAFDPAMRWLEPLSRLIVMLDTLLDDEVGLAAGHHAVVARAQELLTIEREQPSEFMVHYMRHFDTSPDLVAAHATVQRQMRPRALGAGTASP